MKYLALLLLASTAYAQEPEIKRALPVKSPVLMMRTGLPAGVWTGDLGPVTVKGQSLNKVFHEMADIARRRGGNAVYHLTPKTGPDGVPVMEGLVLKIKDPSLVTPYNTRFAVVY